MKKSTTHKIEATLAIGAGIAAASIAATLLFGRNGKKNRKELKDWSVKMKNDVVSKARELQTVTGPIYNKIIQEVAKKYEGVKEISKGELRKEIASLKKEWSTIIKGSKKASTKKKAKKTVTK